jgi:4-hydroxy-tetrahydrodipicolinate synthase
MCRAGQYTDAMKIQFRVLELFDTMLFNFEFPDGFRAAADLRGFNLGRGRQPMSSTQQVDRSALQKVLQCILADFGVVGSPDAGCPPRSGNASNDKVAQIVFEVLHELERRGIV